MSVSPPSGVSVAEALGLTHDHECSASGLQANSAATRVPASSVTASI